MQPKRKNSEKNWDRERAKEVFRALLQPAFGGVDHDRRAAELAADFHDTFRFSGPSKREMISLLPKLLENFYGFPQKPPAEDSPILKFCDRTVDELWIRECEPDYNGISRYAVIKFEPDSEFVDRERSKRKLGLPSYCDEEMLQLLPAHVQKWLLAERNGS